MAPDVELKLDGVPVMDHLAVMAEDVGGVLRQVYEQIAALRTALGK